jgi:predicted nucleic-acid-binding protein
VIAINTNVLIRLLVNDDEAQGSRARAAFEAEDIWIGKTVLLETFWVLRSAYEFDDTVIAHAIEGALGLNDCQVGGAAACSRGTLLYYPSTLSIPRRRRCPDWA